MLFLDATNIECQYLKGITKKQYNMRTKIYGVLLFMGLGVLVSCNNDDDNPSQKEESISGVWHLENVSGGFTGVDLDYSKGEVKWTFNEGNKTLVIENNIMTTGPKDIHAGLDSGTYPYTIEEDKGMKTLTVNNNVKGVLIITSDTLKIDDGVDADGLITKFIR